MKRSFTLIGMWLALACLLYWSGRIRADDPNCASCDCSEHEAWCQTFKTESYVITEYDENMPDVIGKAVKTAYWKDWDGVNKSKVYHTVCLTDSHKDTGEKCRTLLYKDNWNPICKRTGTQTDSGWIATKYDKSSNNYDFPDQGKFQNRYICGGTIPP